MYGYIIAGIIGLALLAFVIRGLAQAKPVNNSLKSPQDRPVQNNAPAADEPTPDKSVTADSRKIRNAREHTPPA